MSSGYPNTEQNRLSVLGIERRRKTVDAGSPLDNGKRLPLQSYPASSSHSKADPQTSGVSRRSSPGPIHLNPASAVAGAATIKLASSAYTNADFEPLGMPSPERELLDPMATYSAPDHKGKNNQRSHSSLSDSELLPTHFRANSTYREVGKSPKLASIAASPVGTPVDENGPAYRGTHRVAVAETAITDAEPEDHWSSQQGRHPPLLSAPLRPSDSMTTDYERDYFGLLPQSDASPNSREGLPASALLVNVEQSSRREQTESADGRATEVSTNRDVAYRPKPKLQGHNSHDIATESRLDGQKFFQSKEAPAALPSQMVDEASRHVTSTIEREFREHGYLLPPTPSDELERRKALYRFNILHTSQDVNFDRIAHLAKLVFNTKIVLIALIDDKYQWHKADHGIGQAVLPRAASLCAHAILAK